MRLLRRTWKYMGHYLVWWIAMETRMEPSWKNIHTFVIFRGETQHENQWFVPLSGSWHSGMEWNLEIKNAGRLCRHSEYHL